MTPGQGPCWIDQKVFCEALGLDPDKIAAGSLSIEFEGANGRTAVAKVTAEVSYFPDREELLAAFVMATDPSLRQITVKEPA